MATSPGRAPAAPSRTGHPSQRIAVTRAERHLSIDETAGIGGVGAAENFKFAIRAIRVGDGPVLNLTGPGSVTAVVGANNVGKSTLLGQVVHTLSTHSLTQSPTPRIVTEVADLWTGTDADMEAWLRANCRVDDSGADITVTRRGRSVHLNAALQRRLQSTTPFTATEWLVDTQHQSALKRITVTQQTERLGSISDPPNHPFHVLLVNPDARQKVEALAQKLFGVRLCLDTLSGNLNYRVGEPTVAAPLANDLNLEYADAVGKLPGLHDQGDGFKSALGLLIPLVTDVFPVTLIDEPEAFLHPPQARIMGTEIAKLAKESQSQIIVATHDKNILQGLVESRAPVDIIHLTRTDDTTAAKLLEANDVTQLWTDPMLRYSNALDGLFHSAVIVTEADRDSHFYEAAIDADRETSSPESPAHNLMFLGSNGKQNMARIVALMRKLGVRTVSCPDLDILDDSKVLRRLVEAHGGNWEDLEPIYKKATNEFKGNPSPPTVQKAKQDIDAAFAKNTDQRVTESLAKAVKKAVTFVSKWSKLKESGDRAFKADKESATALLDALDELGIVTVKVGILENFLTTTSAPKGPEWLPIAFAAGAQTTTDAAEQAKWLLKAAGISEESA